MSKKQILIDLEVSDEGIGYEVKHVEVRLRRRQAHALKCLVSGLHAANAKRANGQNIVRSADAVYYLIDRIAEEIAEEERAAAEGKEKEIAEESTEKNPPKPQPASLKNNKKNNT